MFLEKQLLETEHYINYSDRINSKISAKGVDWHIDHLLKVLIGVSKTLQRSDPKEYKWNFNFIRSIILTLQTIPKGKGKAPKAVVAIGDIKKEEIYEQLKEARDQLAKLDDLPNNSNFQHPYFGMLNFKQSRKFLKIHTKHHLKIIDNIIA
jgi:hypothetical protein